MFYVYCLQNTVSDKKYYGYTNLNPVTISFDTLLGFAASSDGLVHLYNSMKKYGKEAFNMDVCRVYTSKDNAHDCMDKLTANNKTHNNGKGYNYFDAQLIPCCDNLEEYEDYLTTLGEVSKQCADAFSDSAAEAPQEPYSLFDVIIVCTKSLSDMKEHYIEGEFTDFMIAYDAFNRYIPITGILEHFCLAQSSIMMQLLKVCKDALGVYIGEHELV